MKQLYVWISLGMLVYGAFWPCAAHAQLNKGQAYSALKSEDLSLIEGQIQALQGGTTETERAFLGALLMKQAGLLKGARNKLEAFKQGRELLESAIAAQPQNGEFRFLRLMIQEHAPAMLKYNEELQQDARHIRSSFAHLPAPTRAVILAYSQESEFLDPEDF
ncbi:MAG: hypothetical protein D6730_18270 [Bacteroidetes bacterium]|nr:MAG: hypothetical protein D6730_18270 [Bacteroidota bacterium]